MGGRMHGKVVFITGIACGQGRSHAVRLAEEGADIIGVDVPEPIENLPYELGTQDDLDETVRLVEKTGRRIVALPADVRDKKALKAALDRGVAELGRLDAVVANAGIAPIGPAPLSAYFDAVDVDLVGVLNAFSVALAHLASGASLIATGSVAGLIPGSVDNPATGPGGSGYGFAKRAITALVRELSVVLAPHSIRVNAVHPSNCNTRLLHNPAMYQVFRPDLDSPTREDAMAAFGSLQALPIAYIEPVDVSNAVVYLACEESRYVTGMQLRVDGGAVPKLVPLSPPSA